MLEVQGDDSFRSGRPVWQSLSTELLQHNVRMATTFAEYWRSVAEINITTLFPFCAAVADAPSKRRRNFIVIQGGK